MDKFLFCRPERVKKKRVLSWSISIISLWCHPLFVPCRVHLANWSGWSSRNRFWYQQKNYFRQVFNVYHLQYICNSVLFLKKFKSMHQRNAVFRVFSFNNLFLLLEKKYLHFLKPVLYHISSKKLVSYNNISILYSVQCTVWANLYFITLFLQYINIYPEMIGDPEGRSILVFLSFFLLFFKKKKILLLYYRNRFMNCLYSLCFAMHFAPFLSYFWNTICKCYPCLLKASSLCSILPILYKFMDQKNTI